MTDRDTQPLRDLIAAELALPVDPRITALAAAIAAEHPGAAGVLFYGSCLREETLDGLMLDFYLIVDSYSLAFGRGWLAAANRLLPPNVFPFEAGGLMAKYAVLSGDDFRRLASAETRNVSVWARFAQPSRLVWSRDAGQRDAIVAAVSGAAPALLAATRPRLPDRLPILDIWRQAFALTYRAELRAERRGRATSLVAPYAERYRAMTLPALHAAGLDAVESHGFITFAQPVTEGERRSGRRAWARRRREGKALTLLRLVKASATWSGGIDYLAWKVGRHSGQYVTVKPWQRRWPLVGALTLLPRLIARGAIR